MSIENTIAEFRSAVPSFVATDIVDITSGMSLGGGSANPDFDASVASATFTQLVKANATALDLLGLGAPSCEDILITTESIYILIRMLGEEYYHGLAVSKNCSLGMARVLMKRFEPRLLADLRELSA